MGTSCALICHVVPGSSGQEASSLRNLYIQGSDLLKCNFRLSWLLKTFTKGGWFSMKVQGTRFCFYFHQVQKFVVSSGIPVKLASV